MSPTKVPAIAFSGHLGADDVARVRRLGFDGLVEKGGEPLEVLRSLRDTLSARLHAS